MIEISIDASNIGIIKIRRKGKIGNGVLVGALTGSATGALIGLFSGDDPDTTGGFSFYGEEVTWTNKGTKAGEKALAIGISMAFVGSGVGAIIASKKEKIFINGDINNYNNQLEILKSYSMAINK